MDALRNPFAPGAGTPPPKLAGRDDILIVLGGVVPERDHAALRDAGAAAIFGPGTVIPNAAGALLRLLFERLGLPIPPG